MIMIDATCNLRMMPEDDKAVERSLVIAYLQIPTVMLTQALMSGFTRRYIVSRHDAMIPPCLDDVRSSWANGA